MAENEIVLSEKALRVEEGLLFDAAANSLTPRAASFALSAVTEKTQGMLLQMFADPYVLDKTERADLVRQLRDCVKANPRISELRVIFGMALCVNLEVPDAIEEFREGVRLAPQSFVAQLKMGELWMRLRVIDKAEEHTQRAARLAANRMQAELARRQGASLRAMRHAGIERGGYQSPWSLVMRIVRRFRRREQQEAIVTADIG